jgi:hypothetical protein
MPKETVKKTKKTASKKKPASKTSLVKKLKDAGLTVPEGADAKEMQHRLKYYTDLDTAGYNVRLFRGWGSQYDEHPISMLTDRKAMYWLPPSDMADKIVQTKMVAVVKRGLPLHNAIVIDIPVGYGE